MSKEFYFFKLRSSISFEITDIHSVYILFKNNLDRYLCTYISSIYYIGCCCSMCTYIGYLCRLFVYISTYIYWSRLQSILHIQPLLDMVS